MENTIGQRIKQLRNHYNLGVKEFATKCNLSHVAIFHLENGKTLKPHRSSLKRIAMVFGSSTEWILHGRKEMLPNGTVELTEGSGTESFWKDEAYLEIKSRNAMLEKEVERLWQMMGSFAGHVKTDFRSIRDAG
jgi:transcriptional regulator with XRE-family HTH domain